MRGEAFDYARQGVGEVSLRNYPLWRRGKVRDIFDAGDRLIFVSTDRVSAFDVILPNLVPGRGRILTEISRFWFEATNHICSNHVETFDAAGLDVDEMEASALDGRIMQVRKADRIDVECVVRARLAGSGWSEYAREGTLAGEAVPDGLAIGDPLPELRFTPATKNDTGHDVNITRAELANTVGREMADQLERLSLTIFEYACDVASDAGFVLSDTKFEFGFFDDELGLIDELLTPDSSRYWDATSLRAGEAPAGYDKQVVRDWLIGTGWNKEPPAPVLPDDIIQTAMERYETVLERLRSRSTDAGSAGAGIA